METVGRRDGDGVRQGRVEERLERSVAVCLGNVGGVTDLGEAIGVYVGDDDEVRSGEFDELLVEPTTEATEAGDAGDDQRRVCLMRCGCNYRNRTDNCCGSHRTRGATRDPPARRFYARVPDGLGMLLAKNGVRGHLHGAATGLLTPFDDSPDIKHGELTANATTSYDGGIRMFFASTNISEYHPLTQ